MKIKALIVFTLCLLGLGLQAETISFKASDGLSVTADIYIIHDKSAPLILLFHQAGWSRGEYQEIAPRLNSLGFNCMAIDQRSGKTVNGVENLTNRAAKSEMKSTAYLDALPDILGAIEYAEKFLSEGKIILWGSSYSSSLVLKIAGDSPERVEAVLAFSPGEYFGSAGKPTDFIQQSAQRITIPVFVTSSKAEKKNWWAIYEAIPAGNKTFFLPEFQGNHGSRALWSKYTDHQEYWKAVEAFLESIK